MATRKATTSTSKAAKTATPAAGTDQVNAYMRDLDHPLKAEVEAVRAIILKANGKMAERIKWNSPSFHYGKDFGAFHLRSRQYVHLIIVYPEGVRLVEYPGLLEGKHKDRREVKFHGMDDVKAKQAALEQVVNDWVADMDGLLTSTAKSVPAPKG